MVGMNRRMFRGWLALALGLACGCVGRGWAQGFRITGIDARDGRIAVRHEASGGFHHLLQRVDLRTGAQTVVGVGASVSGTGLLEDVKPLAEAGYYRVTRVPNDGPGDSDGDGIDDLYEVGRPGYNPLDPSDALQVSGQTGRTRLEDYLRDETNLALYPYLVGRGIHDVTGPAADGGMMGYADGDQRSEGIHDRQWARAFIAAGRGEGAARVAFVVVDAGQVFHSITQGVHERLQADDELKNFYSYANIVLSATHTHGGAGGHSHHVLYNATIGGFSWQTQDALVHGIYMAIKKAHRNLAPGRILMTEGKLENANENRQVEGFQQNLEVKSPALTNPFGKDNRDTTMLCLRFEHSNRREIAMFNWFPVHGVSFSKQNRMLTGDNKGHAAYLFEQAKGALYPGHGRYAASTGFVAGFANSNPGDLTANLRNSEPGGWPGHGEDDEKRATTIGRRQYEKAMSLYQGASTRVTGPVDHRHLYVDMTSVAVNPPELFPYNQPEVGFRGDKERPPWSTYTGALGVDFARGTLDGEAMSQELIDAFRVANGIFEDPITDEFERRHFPKEVLLTTGTTAVEGMTWTPQTLPVSIMRIGNFAILAVPAELTGMAGYRLRQTVESILPPGTRTVVAGLANDYSGYVVTYEEYMHETRSAAGLPVQSYESASTQFGAFTLAAYQTKFSEMANAMMNGGGMASAPMPRTREPAGILLRAIDPILDLPPLPQARPAELKGKAGCPEGQFWDVGTGYCWSCPQGYNRTVFSVEGGTACELPARSEFSGATRHGQPGCGPGQFFDLLTGYCWQCPSGYDRTIFPVTAGNACERPARSLFAGATRHGNAGCAQGQFFDLFTGACWSCPSGYDRTIFSVEGGTACERPAYSEFVGAQSANATGFFGTDCPSGYVYDFIIRSCFRCPSGSAKLVFRAWNDPAGACERVVPAAYSGATRFNGLCPSGQFWDIGTGGCWSCPGGYNRTVFAVTAGNACEQVIPAAFSGATRFNGLCPSGQFWDLLTGACWSCPAQFNRTVFTVTGGTACERVIAAVLARASRHDPYACEARGAGWFLDIGRNECWSCNGWVRNLNPVTSAEACTGPLAAFGDLVVDPVWLRPVGERVYGIGQRVQVSFWGGHPKNVFGTVGARRVDQLPTFLDVQRWTGVFWETVRTDADWDTTFRWERVGVAASKLTVGWLPGPGTEPGTYRILHRGFALKEGGAVEPYLGQSPTFEVRQ